LARRRCSVHNHQPEDDDVGEGDHEHDIGANAVRKDGEESEGDEDRVLKQKESNEQAGGPVLFWNNEVRLFVGHRVNMRVSR
jgi:hypothetical protein